MLLNEQPTTAIKRKCWGRGAKTLLGIYTDTNVRKMSIFLMFFVYTILWNTTIFILYIVCVCLSLSVGLFNKRECSQYLL